MGNKADGKLYGSRNEVSGENVKNTPGKLQEADENLILLEQFVKLLWVC